MVRTVETATINILGIVFVLTPIPMVLLYGKGIVSDVSGRDEKRWHGQLFRGSAYSSKHERNIFYQPYI